MYPRSIEELIELFEELLPGVGPRQATRFVFALLGRSQEKVEQFGKALLKVHQVVAKCPQCFRIIEGGHDLCDICRDQKRNQKTVMVVEKQSDLEAIEKTRAFEGTYHVASRALPLFQKEDHEAGLHVKELKERIAKRGVEEIILAFGFTPEGETTALYFQKELERPDLKITRLGKGLSTGGEIEYADRETLTASLQKRT